MTKDKSYITTQDIIIPAGTLLAQAANERGGVGYVEAIVGFGRDFSGALVVQVHPDAISSGYFEEKHHA